MSFKDIQGQDKPINLIKESIKNDHLASSYLFIGPDGVGRNMIAKTLAKAVNCLEEEPDSCDRCASCLKIEKKQHPDVHFVGAADVIKIEDIRQLQKEISLKTYEGKKKVFIVDNAHNLSAEGANAFLKILEEPPGNSLIILISSKPALLFKTIISRCRVLKFSSLPRLNLEGILKKDYGLDYYQAHFLAYFCEGRLGYALKLREQDAFRSKNMIIDGLMGLPIGRQTMVFRPMALAMALPNGRQTMSPCPIGSQTMVFRPISSGHLADKDALRLQLNILASWVRDIYLVKIGAAHTELINLDRKSQLLKLITHYSFSDLDEALIYIANSLLYLEQNVNVKLLFSCLNSFLNDKPR